MNSAELKEVKFEEYCPKCKHWDTEDWVDPCSECICEGFREGSFVPLKYEEK